MNIQQDYWSDRLEALAYDDSTTCFAGVDVLTHV